MADYQPNARVKQVLQSSNELAKSTREKVAKERDKILDVIKDTLIECRISEKEAKLKALSEMYDENEVDAINALKADEVLEKRKLAEDYEAIVKKQLQILQADERGKQALQNEIADIKGQQQKRSDALKTRKKALQIERDRSKKIAALPPPLPRSVKLLLKEQEKKKSESCCDNSPSLPQTPDTEEEDFENKENMDEEYHQERRRMQEEWDRKAKKRFNEALKKDRQKQEHSDTLKEIENAEKINRRQMARSISDTSGKVPCVLPDRLQQAERQVAMEDAVENIYKKSNNTKEHAIEDLEGYEDKWESKYKQIDSNLEAKMIDCVPSFVKDNYAYLLEDETTRQCGKRFSGFDDSNDELNVAYIESPTEPVNTSKEIDAVISHLDQMRFELNEAYEKDFKPLLEAENASKVESFDKAVETDILKLPTEDKSIEVQDEMSPKNQLPSASRSVQVDFMNGGVMSFRRRSFGSKFKSHLGYLSEPRTASPEWVEPVATNANGGLESWSSSSYLSLPSTHGLPNLCRLCDSPNCNIPLVEDKKLHKDCIPLSKSAEKEANVPNSELSSEQLRDTLRTSSGTLSSTDMKAKLSALVQQVADKYLKRESTVSSESSNSQEQVCFSSDNIVDHPVRSKSSGSSTVIQKSRITTPDHTAFTVKSNIDSDVKEIPTKSLLKAFSETAIETSIPKTAFNEILQKSGIQQMVLNLMKIPPFSAKKSVIINMDESDQDDLIQRCNAIMAECLSDVFPDMNIIESVASAEVCSTSKSVIHDDVFEEEKEIQRGQYVYHELSTILEMDSALTNDTMQSVMNADKRSLEKSNDSSGQTTPSDNIQEIVSPEDISTISASLVDAPLSEVSELAKSIRFVEKSSPEPTRRPSDVPETPLNLISGTLSFIQTPISLKMPEVYTPRSVSIIEVTDAPSPLTLTDDQSNFSTPSTLKTTENNSGSYGLLTSSSQSPVHSSQSIISQRTPYSSSFYSMATRHPHLTNVGALPIYFRDISSIKQDSSSSFLEESSPSSRIQRINSHLNQAVDSSIHDRHVALKAEAAQRMAKQFVSPKRDESSSDSFKPMTPHSHLSSPGKTYPTQKPYDKKYADSEKPNTHVKRHSSSPSKTSNVRHSPENSTVSFEPLTPHSYLPSLSKNYPGSKRIDDRQDYSDGRDFKHTSYLPSNTGKQSFKTDSGSVRSFQPLTSHTHLSTPNATYPRHKEFSSKEKTARLMVQPSTSPKEDRERYETASSFQPMTPHSHLSSPSYTTKSKELVQYETTYPMQQPCDNKYADLEKRNTHHVKRHSSSPSKTAEGRHSPENSTGSVQPLIPHSYLPSSSKNYLRSRIIDHRQNYSDGRDFKHTSYLPRNTDKQSFRTDSGVHRFQPLTSHAHLSTPNGTYPRHKEFDSKEKTTRLMIHKEDIERYFETASSFQPMSPHSQLSSPSYTTKPEEMIQYETTASGELRLKISNPSKSGNSCQPTNSQSDIPHDSSYKLMKQRLTPNNNTKNHPETYSDYEDCSVGDGSHTQQHTLQNFPGCSSLKDNLGEYLLEQSRSVKDNLLDRERSNRGIIDHSVKHQSEDQKFPNAVKVCSSDFFVPQFSPADLAVENLQDQKAVKACNSDFFVPQLSSADLAIVDNAQRSERFKEKSCGYELPNPPLKISEKTCSDSSASLISSVSLSSGSKTMNSIPVHKRDIYNLKPPHGLSSKLVTSLSKEDPWSSPSSNSEKPYQSVDSPNLILEALKKKYISSRSSKSSSLCITPFSGSSSDTLSEISVSKVTCQSTPIKSIEDIIQETGILDEPDLTLVTTERTLKPDSPEAPRNFSEKCSALEDDLIFSAAAPSIDLSISQFNTPTVNASVSTSPYCDSPSMMSFLKHEMSCLADSKADACSDSMAQSSVHEKLMTEDEFGQQVSKKNTINEYQKRTKRLWNNLTEVKSRKMMEEKREQLAKNRLKMKSYSRKFVTPKKAI